jgi:DNA gyrase/topoisomerase IV subunit A
MKRILFFTVLLSLVITNVLGQSQEREGEKLTDTIVTLVRGLDDTKIIILLENKGFIVKVSLSDFKNDVENWLIEHPHLKEDKKLLDIVLKQAESDNTVNVSRIITDRRLFSRLEYRTASLLENGKCLVLNKESDEIVSEIKVQTYSYHCGFLCGDGGRRFYVNEILILQVMDWIS